MLNLLLYFACLKVGQRKDKPNQPVVWRIHLTLGFVWGFLVWWFVFFFLIPNPSTCFLFSSTRNAFSEEILH